MNIKEINRIYLAGYLLLGFMLFLFLEWITLIEFLNIICIWYLSNIPFLFHFVVLFRTPTDSAHRTKFLRIFLSSYLITLIAYAVYSDVMFFYIHYLALFIFIPVMACMVKHEVGKKFRSVIEMSKYCLFLLLFTLLFGIITLFFDPHHHYNFEEYAEEGRLEEIEEILIDDESVRTGFDVINGLLSRVDAPSQAIIFNLTAHSKFRVRHCLLNNSDEIPDQTFRKKVLIEMTKDKHQQIRSLAKMYLATLEGYYFNDWDNNFYSKIFRENENGLAHGICLGWSKDGKLIEFIIYKDGQPMDGYKYSSLDDENDDLKKIIEQEVPYFAEQYQGGKLLGRVEAVPIVSDYAHSVSSKVGDKIKQIKNRFGILNIYDLNKTK